MKRRLPVVLATLAALVAFLVLLRTSATDDPGWRMLAAGAGFAIFLALAVAGWLAARR